MKKMVEMDCCDACGKPFYCVPEDIFAREVVNEDGKVEELIICDDCFNEGVVYTICDFCGRYVKRDNCITINDGDEYCPACASKAIEELEDNVREAKHRLADAREAFERRKAERE